MFLNNRLRFRTFSSLLLRISIVVALSIGLLGGLSNSSLLQSSQLVSVGAVLFATADGAGSGPCTSIFTPSTADCSLSTALGQAVPGDTIELLTPGTASVYSGNFTIATPSTSSTEQVTIRPATGVTNPILDGGQNGTVVTVNGSVFATIDGVIIQSGKSAIGGGIFNNGGTLTINDDTISGNSAGDGGGVYNLGTFTASNVAILNNFATSGGGIYNDGISLTASNDTISNNSATFGGGIYNNLGTFTASNVTISGNTASNGIGGGIDNSSGTFIAINDTISGNTTPGGSGGGIENGGILTATNDTIAGNSASQGGGIYNFGNLTAVNDTIASNSVAPSGSGGGIYNSNSVVLAASIVADQIYGGNCTSASSITDGGYNVTDDTSCGLKASGQGGTSIVTSSPLVLPPLANNGGPTQTILPRTANPNLAIVPPGAKSQLSNTAAVSLCPTTDQRGVASTPNVACFAGAVQVVPNLYATAKTTTSVACSAESPCSLATALQDVTPGATINLVTPGATAVYSGNFAINTSNTSSTERITIQPASGVANPILDGANEGRVLIVNNGVFASVIGLTIQNGKAKLGAGIGNGGTLTITSDKITGNSASSAGGGIFNSGTLTATNDTISNNNAAGDGGGIVNYLDAVLTASDDTISNNTGSGNYGGGIFNYGGTLNIINDTIAGNKVNGFGGGVFNMGGTQSGGSGKIVGVTTAISDTIVDNSAGSAGTNIVGGIANDGGTINLAASIIADQIASSNCSGPGTINDLGYNVTDDSTCGLSTSSNDVVNTSSKASNPVDLLSPLTNNGGPTPTIAPKAGNPAVDLIPPTNSKGSGPNTVAINGTSFQLCPATDQRGIATPTGTNCDAGSVQLASQSLFFTPIASAIVGRSVTLSATGGGSNNPVTFSVDTTTLNGICTISTSTVRFIGTGKCIIDASQQGSPSYLPAPTVRDAITVTQTKPQVVSSIAQSSITSNAVTITWTPSTNPSYSPATSYQVFEGSAPNKESTTPVSCSTPLTPTSTSCTVAGLNPSTTYYFYVVAVNAAGNSSKSTELSATTNSIALPTTPTPLQTSTTPTTTSTSPSTATTTPQSPSILTNPGYYIAASDGGVFAFGDANYFGSTAKMSLNKPIVGITATPDGKGYWLVGADGGVFAFGDANYLGSAANLNLNQPADSVASVAVVG